METVTPRLREVVVERPSQPATTQAAAHAVESPAPEKPKSQWTGCQVMTVVFGVIIVILIIVIVYLMNRDQPQPAKVKGNNAPQMSTAELARIAALAGPVQAPPVEQPKAPDPRAEAVKAFRPVTSITKDDMRTTYDSVDAIEGAGFSLVAVVAAATNGATYKECTWTF